MNWQLCDECGTNRDVAGWPQIGGNFCTDCAERLLALQCRDCGTTDDATRIFRGRRLCELCIDEIQAEEKWAKNDQH